MNDHKQNLLEQISKAFISVRKPNNNELLHEKCSDSMDIQWLYSLSDWKSLPENLLAYENATLFFLSPKGFQWVLPAYLVWCIRNPKIEEEISFDHVISSLCPGGEYNDFTISKFALMTKEQSETILLFLKYFINEFSLNEIKDDCIYNKMLLAESFWSDKADLHL